MFDRQNKRSLFLFGRSFTPSGDKKMNLSFAQSLPRIRLKRGLVFGGLIFMALLAFEMFNYSTTDFALGDLLGDLRFMSVRWATILAIAFCGIDFAGIARLFTPEQGADEPAEVWYLFGAWLLAAVMNAMLTWWGVSIAILNHDTLGNAVISGDTLMRVVPVFVAIMVFLIRVLIIGTFSVAGERLFSQSDRRQPRRRSSSIRPAPKPSPSVARSLAQSSGASSFRPAPKTYTQQNFSNRPEPTYHPVSMSSGVRPPNPNNQVHQ
jgi:hypothetical protein